MEFSFNVHAIQTKAVDAGNGAQEILQIPCGRVI